LDLIHANLYGPIIIHVIDIIHVSSLMAILDMTMCIWWKSESFEMFKEFRNKVKIEIRKIIKLLQSDQGGEYFNQYF
jgi:hypothetical protein